MTEAQRRLTGRDADIPEGITQLVARSQSAIIARRAAEERLDRSERRTRQLVEEYRQLLETSWKTEHLARISGMLPGRRDLAATASLVLTEVAPVVAAPYGSFYLVQEVSRSVTETVVGYDEEENSSLWLIADYGHGPGDADPGEAADLLQLISDILDLSKVEAGIMDADPGRVDLGPMGDSLRATFPPLTADRDLDFEVLVSQDLPVAVHTDGRRLQQVLRNPAEAPSSTGHRPSPRLDSPLCGGRPRSTRDLEGPAEHQAGHHRIEAAPDGRLRHHRRTGGRCGFRWLRVFDTPPGERSGAAFALDGEGCWGGG
ncbi:hypothetical protein OG977_02260 [Kitasatospora purpeofusca]